VAATRVSEGKLGLPLLSSRPRCGFQMVALVVVAFRPSASRSPCTSHPSFAAPFFVCVVLLLLASARRLLVDPLELPALMACTQQRSHGSGKLAHPDLGKLPPATQLLFNAIDYIDRKGVSHLVCGSVWVAVHLGLLTPWACRVFSYQGPHCRPVGTSARASRTPNPPAVTA
jgi:hypothetical protein